MKSKQLLNPASYGGTRTQEASAKYAARISKPVVSAVPQTRATVSDTTMYDITATFHIELESVNAKETSKRTFVFAVTYPAGVITEKEVEDPDLVRVEYRTGRGARQSAFVVLCYRLSRQILQQRRGHHRYLCGYGAYGVVFCKQRP